MGRKEGREGGGRKEQTKEKKKEEGERGERCEKEGRKKKSNNSTTPTAISVKVNNELMHLITIWLSPRSSKLNLY